MRTILAAIIATVAVWAPAKAQVDGQRQREALRLMLDIASYTEACVPFDVYRKWNVDWKLLNRITGASGITTEVLDNPGVARRRLEIEASIIENNGAGCEAYVSRYGPNGSTIPDLMFLNTEKPIYASPAR